jgi:excisionase family DNA binding protein
MPESSQNKEQLVRVTVSEAARLFGVNPRTIRRAITAQELRYIVVRNRYKISFPSLVAWSQGQTKLRRKRDEQGIGQWIDQWRIRNLKYSPRTPETKNSP